MSNDRMGMGVSAVLDLGPRSALVEIGTDRYEIYEPTLWQAGVIEARFLALPQEVLNAFTADDGYAALWRFPEGVQLIQFAIETLIPHAPSCDYIEKWLGISQLRVMAESVFSMMRDGEGEGDEKPASPSSDRDGGADLRVSLCQLAKAYGMLPQDFAQRVTLRQIGMLSEGAMKTFGDMLSSLLGKGGSDGGKGAVSNIQKFVNTGLVSMG